MKKFSFQEKLNGMVMFQDYRQNTREWMSALRVNGHIGIDVSRGDGDPIPAYFDGVVVYVQYDTIVYLTDPDEDGLCLEVAHAHMKDHQVKVGDRIKIGQTIGYQDSTGPSMLWKDEDSKTGWSHEHVNFREARLGRVAPVAYRWNYQDNSPVGYHIIEDDASIEHFRDPRRYSAQVLERITDCITRQEGFFAPGQNPRFPNGSASYRNNNPGNLRSTDYTRRYLGAEGENGQLARFKTMADGRRALTEFLREACSNLLRSYRGDMSVADFFGKYAPFGDGDNNPIMYAANIVSWAGLRSMNDPISDWLLTEVDWLRKYQFIPGIGPNGDSQFQETFWIIRAFKSIVNKLLKGR